ncbi:hypothetical protein [Phenylobacterium sp. J367]|uniref:hypothetical protein n=1 Tax=Phenylobacterium sp. J367 TaxID=2898435 RepID=UPI0021515819|nr:hypothetical protein [Phenylobacterium sp. J367]MCR5878722.1 hypothetical protein [Phenylobacterium sp. J367]
MAHDPHPLHLSRRQAIAATLGAAAVALAILVVAVIPAEFGRDPTGLGQATGLSRLWAPREVRMAAMGDVPLAREYPQGFRTDTIEIPLKAVSGDPADFQIEYKVRMRKDATLIYEWQVEGAQHSDDLYFDFHGHTLAAQGREVTVATYRQANGQAMRGALTAPFDGIQGWFFQSGSLTPVVVRLKLAGFYDLVPPGEPGNEGRVIANVPAAQARPGF